MRKSQDFGFLKRGDLMAHFIDIDKISTKIDKNSIKIKKKSFKISYLIMKNKSNTKKIIYLKKFQQNF